MEWPNRLVFAFAVVFAVLLPHGTALAQAAAAPPDTVRALVVQYADGFKTVTYRGRAISMSGRPRGTGHMPLIPPGEEYVLKLAATANGRGDGPSAWLPLDRLEITSVLWSDGLVEGDPVPAADEHALDAGTAQQLTAIVALLRAAARDPSAHPLPQLRSEIAALDIKVTAEDAARALDAIPGPARLQAAQVGLTMEAGMRNARTVALRDVDAYIKSAPPPSGYAGWLAGVSMKFDSWRSRITGA